MSAENSSSQSAIGPKVLIIGAGLGGLTFAALLEKAGVPFEIYDRMADIKPLGRELFYA